MSASPAPHRPKLRPPIYNRPDAEAVEELFALNGTPPALLQNQERIDLMLPTIRFHFELSETYENRRPAPLPIPIVAATGIDDTTVPLESVREWRRHTDGGLTVHALEGDHFFMVRAPFAPQEIVS